MTWPEIAEENWRAANELRELGRLRSSVSLAYYSAFAEATGALERRGVPFVANREGPGHAQLPDMLFANLGLDRISRYEVRRAIRRLYSARIQADYLKLDVDQELATKALRDAFLIRRTLGE